MEFKFQKKEVMISSEIGKEVIKKELSLIPKLPGVYRMLNEKDEILYVGKAKNLPNRLKSYVSDTNGRENHVVRLKTTQKDTVFVDFGSTATHENFDIL